MVLVATQNWETLVGRVPEFIQFLPHCHRLNFKSGAVFADPADPAAPFGEVPWYDAGVMAWP